MWKKRLQRKKITDIFLSALFVIAKIWKQPRCPSVGEYINKLVNPDNRVLLSAEKKRAIKPEDIEGP